MSVVALKTLFITYLCILSPLALSANNPVYNGVVLDSSQIVFLQRISNAKNDSIQLMDAYFDYGA